MERRSFLAVAGSVGLTSLAGCSGEGDDGGSDGSGGGGGGSGGESTPTPEQTLTHDIGDSFVVGEGAQSIEYTVNGYETIEDYIGPGPEIGSSPDGIFAVVNLDLENVGDESLDLTSRNLQLIDDQDRMFEADTEASVYAGQDSRIEADAITFDQLQPGLSVTRSVIYDVPSGTYRLAVEPAGVFSNADTHYVPLGDV